MAGETQVAPSIGKRHSRWWWIGSILLLVFALFIVVLSIVASRAEPIVRTRIIETLSTRFHSRVELAGFHVSVRGGLRVSGEGLNIYAPEDLDIHKPGIQPLIGIKQFSFRAGVLNLLRTPMRVHRVDLKGLELNVPAKEQRGQMQGMEPKSKKLKIFVDEFVCDDAALIINTMKPGKLPLEFAIHSLHMRDIGPGQPMKFEATLINPKPVGDIQSDGYFGPWDADAPRDTPVQGNYSFSHADLSTIKGIGGILSSTGDYSGTLGSIAVHGQTETPDFRIAISGHPVPLHTEFHAIVDGTSGDTYLKPVNAKILQSNLVANGFVVRVKDPPGHEVNLDVMIDDARIQDLLTLGVRTVPPVMTGAVKMTTKLDLPPGAGDITERLKLDGKFQISGAHFTNDKVQSKVDALSLRSQGDPEAAKEETGANVQSDLSGVFKLQQGLLSFSQLHFLVPGTKVNLVGQYSLDGNQFDFHGTVRMDAKLSQMMTGWKSVLLKPVDPFFRKHGAGTEIPVKVTGTKSEPHFGLDFGHKDEAAGKSKGGQKN
ncbi:MAG TPA: hypothetical protein VLW84_04975 [Terriglobales bacterium]|nr:hypothetical protein [Terriglobales bacterium]